MINIIRPLNFIITIAAVIVAAYICTEGGFQTGSVLLAALSAGFSAAGGNVINDIFDEPIDKINKPERPLPSGKIKTNTALLLYLLFVAFSILLSLQVSFTAFLTVLFANLLLFLYSFQLKKIPFAGNIIVSFLTGMVFIFGGIVVENITGAIVPALFAFLINLIREIIKDMEDIKGDSDQGILTLPSRLGFSGTRLLVALLGFILILSTFYPFLTELYRIEYFVIVMVLVNPLIVYCIKSMFENSEQKNLNKLSNLLKFNMVFGLIAIYMGQ
ncbi:MAG: geranylgeranylglycerol-phosphate geranylgeranyltransferase [Ignavibacteriaceae bacterium]